MENRQKHLEQDVGAKSRHLADLQPFISAFTKVLTNIDDGEGLHIVGVPILNQDSRF